MLRILQELITNFTETGQLNWLNIMQNRFNSQSREGYVIRNFGPNAEASANLPTCHCDGSLSSYLDTAGGSWAFLVEQGLQIEANCRKPANDGYLYLLHKVRLV